MPDIDSRPAEKLPVVKLSGAQLSASVLTSRRLKLFRLFSVNCLKPVIMLAFVYCMSALSVAVAADITQLRILNHAGVAQTNEMTTFGHAFKQGDVPAGSNITARLQSGASVSIQSNAKATHADGSLRHAIISAKFDRLAAEGDTLILSDSIDSAPTELLSAADLLSSEFEATVSLTSNGESYSRSARDLLQSGVVTTWFQGPLASEFIISGAMLDDSSNPHPHLTAYFHIRAYVGLEKVRVDVVLENNWSFVEGAGNRTYDVEVSFNGVAQYAKSDLTHYSQARWHKRFWVGGEPTHYVWHDHDYLQSTRAIPRYEDISPTEEFLAGVRQSTEPMDNGDQEDNMQDTGFQQGIGPLPRWDAVYAISGDPRAFNYMLANADAGGAYSVHYRDKNTGLPISIDEHPRATLADPVASRPKFPSRNGSSPYYQGNWSSHQPSMGFLPYLITGDYYYLEEAQFWTAYNLVWPNYTGRNESDGHWYRSSVRGIAWAYRSLAQVAYITPDDHPMKSYFLDKLSKNLSRDTELYVSPGGPHKNNLGAMYSSEGNDEYRFFDYFMSWTAQYMVDLGFDQARQFRDYKMRFPIGLMGLSEDEYCFQLAPRYTWKVGPAGRDTFYSSFSEVYQAMYPDLGSVSCGSTAMRDALDLSTTNEMIGNQFSTTYYYANLQPALAAAADSGLTGGAEAWQRSQLSGVKPDYRNQPIWAVIPHSTGPSLSFSANPALVPVGGSATLNWSAPAATSCVASEGWQGNQANTGSQTIANISAETTFVIRCDTDSGSTERRVQVLVSQTQTQLSDLPAGHWLEFENSRLDAVFPNPEPRGNTGPESVMNGWSGGAFDSARDQLLVWGGGHQDYAGNELYAFSLQTQSWQRLSEPSTTIEADRRDGRYPDGQPASRHTYNALQYAPNVDQLYSLGFAAAYGPEARSGHSVDAFNFTAGEWQARANKPTGGIGFGDITAYHPGSGMLWHHGGANGRLTRYDPINDVWTEYNSRTYLEYYATAAIDPTRNIMVAIGRNQFYVWDLDNPNSSPSSPDFTGPNPVSAQAPGFVYDPVSDQFVAWHGGASVYTLNPETWVWTKVDPASSNTVIPTAAEPRGTYGRFRYVPSINAFIVVNRTNENVYAFKLTGGGGSSGSGPSLAFSAEPTVIDAGGDVRLIWVSDGAESCSASGGWNGSKPVSSEQLIQNVAQNTMFTLSCANAEGVTNRTVSVTVRPEEDATAPPPPQSLAASVEGTTVKLTWQSPTEMSDDVAEYLVRRDGEIIARVENTNEYLDILLVRGRSFRYQVSAADDANNESEPVDVTVAASSLGQTVLRVNAGSEQNFTDSFNQTWLADFGFNTGSLGSTSTSIAGSVDQEIFQTQRWDPLPLPELEYKFSVENSNYWLVLYFADYYPGAHQVGARTFDVEVEGDVRLRDVDIFSEVGANQATSKLIRTEVRDSELNLRFLHGEENTMISAIELVRIVDSVPPVSQPPSIPRQPAGPSFLPSVLQLLDDD